MPAYSRRLIIQYYPRFTRFDILYAALDPACTTKMKMSDIALQTSQVRSASHALLLVRRRLVVISLFTLLIAILAAPDGHRTPARGTLVGALAPAGLAFMC